MDYAQQWKDRGYLIVPQVIDPKQIARLYEICEATYEQWKHNSAEDNQPGGWCYRPNGWVMIHLNHPKYYRGRQGDLLELLNAVAAPLVQQILRQIFREESVMLQTNYYIDPPGESWNGNWHRDCQFAAPADDDVKRAIELEADPSRTLHMHIPFVPTQATEVVPGSHYRWDTPEEYHVRKNDPHTEHMPNKVAIQLQPGDLAFFHTNTVHRGIYHQGVKRRTIAVTFGRVSYPDRATAAGMKQLRGYVATYQPWFLLPGYLDGCTPAARAYYEKFIDTYRDTWKSEYLAELTPGLQDYFTKLAVV